MNKKIFLILGIMFGLLLLVGAIELTTRYNPWTGRLDYVSTGNFSGDNVTADNFFGNLTGAWNDSYLYVPYTGSTANVVLGDYNFSVGTTDLFVNSNTGNVGIGTTTPQRELHVNGDILSNATINATGDVCIEGGNCLSTMSIGDVTWTTLWTQVYNETEINAMNTSNNNYIVYTNTTMKNYVDTRGFGVGSLTGAGTAMRVPLWNGTTSLNNSNIYQGGAGNIGIGHTAPVNTLHLAKSQANVRLAISAFNTGASEPTLAFEASNSATIGTYVETSDNDVLGDILFRGVDAQSNLEDAAKIRVLQDGAAGSEVPSEIIFQTSDTTSGPTTKMVIKPDGNVGIGTITPQNTLNVDGDFNVTGDSYLEDTDFNGGWTAGGASIIDGNAYVQTLFAYNISGLIVTDLFINGSLMPVEGFDDTFDIGNNSLRWRDMYLSGEVHVNGTGDNYFLGNVGIGTTSPDGILHINKTTGVLDVFFDSFDDNSYINFRAGLDGGVEKAGIKFFQAENMKWELSNTAINEMIFYDATRDANALVFEPNGDLRLMESGGNVGIGTITPQNTLNVVGDLNVTGTIIANKPHMYGVVTAPQIVSSGGVWYNMTFNASESEVEGNITFTNNRTLIINETGDYLLQVGAGLIDTAASPSANVAFRIALNGAQLDHSYVEVDTTKQNANQRISKLVYAKLTQGDKLEFQYISSATTVAINSSNTYNTGVGQIAHGWIQRID